VIKSVVAASVAEERDFEDISHDLVVLNQLHEKRLGSSVDRVLLHGFESKEQKKTEKLTDKLPSSVRLYRRV